MGGAKKKKQKGLNPMSWCPRGSSAGFASPTSIFLQMFLWDRTSLPSLPAHRTPGPSLHSRTGLATQV